MGLSSAMTTALTGLSAAETQIDVAGNNLANSQTVGFKASDVIFANQFLRTLSQGSTPTENNGGTNPRQIGLGVQVAGHHARLQAGNDRNQLQSIRSGNPGRWVLHCRGPARRTALHAQRNLQDQLGKRAGLVHRQPICSGTVLTSSTTLQETQLVPLTIPLGICRSRASDAECLSQWQSDSNR